MAMTDADTLAALDWHTLACQCQAHACAHHNRPCTRLATRRVEVHAIDDCNNPELGPFGNHLFLTCQPCFGQLAVNTGTHLKRLNRYGRATCLTCGAPIAEITDVIREITEL